MSRSQVEFLRLTREYSWDKEAWFPPLADGLKDLTVAQAAWQPTGGGNTIWQIVNHLNYYNQRLLHRITGEPLGPALADNYATFGAGDQAADEAAWQSTVEQTRAIAAGWARVLAELTDADLDRPLPQGTLGEALVAWIGHDAYHTGQIVLLRKQQGSWPAQRG